MTPSNLVVASALCACAAMPVHAAEKTFDLSGFSEVSVSRGINVTIETGPFAVEAETSRRGLMRRLDVSVRGDKLIITRDNGWSFFMMGMTDRYDVTVSMPELEALTANSGSSVKADLDKPVDALDIDVSSGAQVELSFANAGKLSVEASSGSNIELAGLCGDAQIDASGGSDVDAEDLTCQTADLSASSGADIEIAVIQSVSGRVSSGGDIDVFGAPTILQMKESSGGDMKVSQ